MRYLIVMIAAVAIFACAQPSAQNGLKEEPQSVVRPTNAAPIAVSVDGIYEFVSRTTTITAPQQSTERLAAPDWYGLWIFRDGYFSQTRMKNIRPDWTPAQFPSNPQGLGFDGSSGTYVIKGDRIELDYRVNFFPGRIGAVEDLKYSLANDTLTLTWEMLPGPEFGSTGQRVTVLRRIK